MGELSIRQADPSDVPAICDLMNRSLGRTHEVTRDPAYWNWKHAENPFGVSCVLIGELDGRIVGMRAFMRWQLQSGASRLLAAKPVDTVTDPDYQRRGIFSQLTRAAIDRARSDGVALLFNTPNQNSLPGYLKLGWKTVGELRLQARLQRPCRTLWRYFGPGQAPQTVLHEDFLAGPAVPVSCVLDEMAATWDEGGWGPVTASTPTWQTPRSIEFLRWRYLGHPHLRYFACVDRSRGGLTLVAFLRARYRRRVRELMLCDVLATTGVEADQMTRFLTTVLKSSYSDCLFAHADTRSILGKGLRRVGFRFIPRKRISLVACGLNDSFPSSQLEKPENWSLALGDLEGL